MSKISCIRLGPSVEDAFYALTAEYLPDSDPQRMRELSAEYPEAFLALMDGETLIGAAFGWPRALADPSDPSFTLGGIVIHWNWQRQGHGKRLLAAFEQAAASCGAPRVSVGSAGGYVEDFYLGCGYRPKEYKVWQDGAIRVEKTYRDLEDYRSYRRIGSDGFVVMEKDL